MSRMKQLVHLSAVFTADRFSLSALEALERLGLCEAFPVRQSHTLSVPLEEDVCIFNLSITFHVELFRNEEIECHSLKDS